jgi:hypothetical protein
MHVEVATPGTAPHYGYVLDEILLRPFELMRGAGERETVLPGHTNFHGHNVAQLPGFFGLVFSTEESRRNRKILNAGGLRNILTGAARSTWQFSIFMGITLLKAD